MVDWLYHYFAPMEAGMTDFDELDLTEKLGFTPHAKATWAISAPGYPDLINVMTVEEVGEDWVTARPEGSDTLYTFGNHPQADVSDLGALTLLPKEDA